MSITFQPHKNLLLTHILVGAGGIVASIIGAWLVITLLLKPPMGEIIQLFSALSTSAILSLLIGFVAIFFVARVSPSLLLTLTLAYIWTAILIIMNVWNGARLMFFNLDHDLPLAISLLVFASILAAAFGMAVTLRVVGDLRELSFSAQNIAAGNLSIRADVYGRDEVSRVAKSFNEMAEKLEEAEEVRAELNQLRKDLVSWTSHDLRTPLTSMRAMVEAMRDELVTDPEMMMRYHQSILKDIEALNTLMDDLFEYSQLESGGLKIHRDYVSLSGLIGSLLEQFRGIADQKGIHLASVVPSDVDPVLIDQPLMERVFSNLLINACRHTPEGGTVGIDIERDQTTDFVTVKIWDTGSGFEQKDLPHVFEQFYRGEEARSRAKGGGGLGLAIAKSIVEGHGGEIRAGNRPKGGAELTIIFPGS